MQDIKLFTLLCLLSSCASTIVIEQKYCPRDKIFLAAEFDTNESMEEVVWTPWAPFGKVQYDLKKNETCGTVTTTPFVFKDSFGTVLSSLIPFFSQTSIFYNR